MTGGWPIEDRVNSGPTGQPARLTSVHGAMTEFELLRLVVTGWRERDRVTAWWERDVRFPPEGVQRSTIPRSPGQLVDNR